MTTSIRRVFALWIVALLAMPGVSAFAQDAAHIAKAKAAADKAIAALKKTQGADGSWSPKPGPAVTGMVVAGMLQNGVDPKDPAVQKAVAYILSKQKDSGGIYDEILPNYNTSISLMTLGQLRGDPKIDAAIKKAQDYLRSLQFDGQKDDKGNVIDKNHPHYGGAGYGGHGRPDLSNTAIMLAGLNDSGLDCEDPAFQRAMTFITQLQGTKSNTRNGDKITPDGGFIYAPTTEKTNGKLETKVKDAEKDSSGFERLRTYGSMTYAGFMSYLYAKIDRNDPRVVDAYNWIKRNYTLEQNPGVGMQGYYYYLHMMSRALDAWATDPNTGKRGETTITSADGKKHNWPNEMIDKIVSLQGDDGLWTNKADRWMEGDSNLVTAFALVAMGHALDK